MSTRKRHSLWVTLLVEVVVYALLLVVYFLLVLQFLGGPLDALFQRSLLLYGIVALSLIVAQGVLLDFVTSFLVQRLLRDEH
jgi:hypothetical protein